MKIIENICEVKSHKLDIRVWFHSNGIKPFEDWEMLNDYVQEHRRVNSTLTEYAESLAATLPRVNAVEVREGDHGVVYYPDWP